MSLLYIRTSFVSQRRIPARIPASRTLLAYGKPGMSVKASSSASSTQGSGRSMLRSLRRFLPSAASTVDDIPAADTNLIPGCDFGNAAHNPNDVAFTCNNKLIGARQMLATYRQEIGAEPFEYDSARDENGHGTHTASTSGGNADVERRYSAFDRGIVSGIAPRAQSLPTRLSGPRRLRIRPGRCNRPGSCRRR